MPFNSPEVQRKFEQMDVRYSMTHSIQDVWMSVARAFGTVNEQNLTNSAIEKLVHSFLEEGTTALLLADLERANEEFLGFIFASDGKQYCVYRRDSTGPFPFFGVYLMSDDYITWGVYKIEITGIFRKKVTIGTTSRSSNKKTISCTFEDFRFFGGNPDRLIGSLMTAGQIVHLFPGNPQCSGGYSLTHWWLPCRAWLHGVLWNG
jgi:hypothetical protein